MSTKIKIFEVSKSASLEREVNDFIEEMETNVEYFEFKDIKFHVDEQEKEDDGPVAMYVAMLLYTIED